MPKKAKTCFVVCPIGPEGTDVRDRSDKVLKHLIKPAAKKCGYKAIRADEISRPGIITIDVIKHLYEDELVIADLTGHNANVFYELAARHTWGKPAIQMIHKDEQIPFDVAQVRTIMYDHTDLDSAEKCKDEIISQIKEVEENPTPPLTPISTAAAVLSLSHSQEPLDQRIAELIELTQAQSQRLGEIRNLMVFGSSGLKISVRAVAEKTLVRLHEEILENRKKLGDELSESLEAKIVKVRSLVAPSIRLTRELVRSSLTELIRDFDQISLTDFYAPRETEREPEK